MNLLELELSLKSIDILQKIGVYHLQDISDMMIKKPTIISLALARIALSDFREIMKANLETRLEGDKIC